MESRISFGMPVLVALPSPEETAALCARLGLDFVELNMNLPACQADTLRDAARLRGLAKQNGIYFTLHLPEELDPFGFCAPVAEAWRAVALDAIGMARSLDMPVVNMHLSDGVYFTLPNERVYLYDRYQDTYLSGVRAFARECAAALAGGATTLCIENCGGFKPFHEKALDILLDCPHTGLTLDVGHMAEAGMADGPFYAAHSGYLRHMHLHGSGGGKCHLSLSEGDGDIAGALGLARARSCRCVLETKTPEALEASAAWLKERGWL